MRPVDAVLARLKLVRSHDMGWMALCPAHMDANRSLSVAEGDDGRVLLKCFAGCSVEQITVQLGLKMSQLFNDTKPGLPAAGKLTAPNQMPAAPREEGTYNKEENIGKQLSVGGKQKEKKPMYPPAGGCNTTTSVRLHAGSVRAGQAPARGVPALAWNQNANTPGPPGTAHSLPGRKWR